MSSTQIVFSEQAREKIVAGATILANAVRLTLGPRGRTVVIEKKFGAPSIVNSGVLVAKSITLEDPFENMGVQLVREVAAKTADEAGDGTTTATVLAHSQIVANAGRATTSRARAPTADFKQRSQSSKWRPVSRSFWSC